jgi:hypothetical protein
MPEQQPGTPPNGAGGAAVPDATTPSAASMPVGVDVGTKVIHRLSNTQYDNTIRDLLGTELRFGDSFVHEEAEGFDNIAASLSMSPRQVDDYFRAAEELAADVFANPSLRERILTCTPDLGDSSCAKTVIETFGRRAFRRPLTEVESSRLLGQYESAVSLGEDATAALQHVVHVILASPQFLYRIEFDPNPADATVHPLDGYELASRLSYALWGSTPDDTLLGLAEAGTLLAPQTLEAEVDRMLEDERSETLVTDFAAQWLGSNRLAEHSSSLTIYPTWSPQLALSMQQEMELYFSEFLREDRSYDELLTADFNFVDASLAELYGVAAPPQGSFQRIEITDDSRRGLLGLAGFLTHTSRETRSSPIIRGRWVLDALLCQPLTVPPGLVVQPLPEPTEDDTPTTVRELMDQHRADPACAGCHNLIDPIGLALENFDGIGRYRDEYENGRSIDTAGTLPDGTLVNSLESLSAAVTADERFVACAARKFNIYALGRSISDEGYLGQILYQWRQGELSLRNLIKQTIVSDTFVKRHAETQ